MAEFDLLKEVDEDVKSATMFAEKAEEWADSSYRNRLKTMVREKYQPPDTHPSAPFYNAIFNTGILFAGELRGKGEGKAWLDRKRKAQYEPIRRRMDSIYQAWDILNRLPYAKVAPFYEDCLKHGLVNTIEIWKTEPLITLESEDTEEEPIQVIEGKAKVIQGWPIKVIKGKAIKYVKKNEKEDSNENQNNEEKHE